MTLILLKICVSLVLLAFGKLLTLGLNLPEGYEDERGFHQVRIPVRNRE